MHCNNDPNIRVEYFHHPKKFSDAPLQSIPPFHTGLQVTTDLLAITTDWFGLSSSTSSKCRHTPCPLLSRLLWLRMLILRSIIHVVAYIHSLHFSLPICPQSTAVWFLPLHSNRTALQCYK